MASSDPLDSTTEKERKCWEHPFHLKELTLEIAGYLITGEHWRNEILKLEEKTGILKGEGKFTDFIEAFKELNGFEEFVNSTKEGKGYTKEEPIYREKCRKEIEREFSRFRQLWDEKDAKKRWEEYAKDLEVRQWVEDIPISTPTAEEKSDQSSPKDNIPREYPEPDLEEETEKRVKKASNEFKIVFGRRDHHLVASLVEALWDMETVGEIRVAFVPREQLLSVDMEYREIREVTLQLHPNKPVYKRRDKDEMRGFEEAFIGVTPWCRVPGGRYLSGVIDDNMYKQISGRTEVEVIWIEDEWRMSERKRRQRAERKLHKTAVKVTDPYDQVNHYLPILKNISGFRGLIRDDAFYEGLQGLIYVIQVVEVGDPEDLLTHAERQTSRELQFRRHLRDLKRERALETKS